MKRKSFKMYLKEGCQEEYMKRYNALWPDLKELFRDCGILDFTIYLDKETNWLYAFQTLEKHFDEKAVSDNLIMKRWWEFMSDIVHMDCNNHPIILSLDELFHIDWGTNK